MNLVYNCESDQLGLLLGAFGVDLLTRLGTDQLPLGRVIQLDGHIVGIVLGIFGAWATSRAMQSALFGVGTVDATVLAVTAITMIVVVLLAAYIPARRATKVDPMVARGAE
jgi:CBS domain containing-hemolysin-like protein